MASLTGKAVNDWSADDVSEYLQSLGLESLVQNFRSNGVSGSDLLTLSQEEFQSDLSCTHLQMKKIVTGVSKYGATAAAAASFAAPAAAAPAPVAAAPAYPPAAAAAPAPAYPPVAAAAAPVAMGAAAGMGYAAGAGMGAGVGGVPREQYAQAQQLLQQADQELQQAAQLMHRAARSAGITAGADVAFGMERRHEERREFGFGGFRERREGFGFGRFAEGMGSMMSNLHQNTEMRQADQMVQDAAGKVQAAMRCAPDIPYVDINSVNQLRSGFLGVVLAPGFSEVMRHEEMKRQMRKVEAMDGSVRQALSWVGGRAAGY